MENESIESILQSLGLDSCVEVFKSSDITLELLTPMSNKELKENLVALNLTLGSQIKIIKKIQEIKVRGTYPIFKYCSYWFICFFFKTNDSGWFSLQQGLFLSYFNLILSMKEKKRMVKDYSYMYLHIVSNLQCVLTVDSQFFCSYGARCNWRRFTELGVRKLCGPIQAAWAKARAIKVIFWYGVERDTKRTKFTPRETNNHNQKDTWN